MFPMGVRQLPKVAIIFQFFSENCMKMKELGLPGGGRPWCPLGSAKAIGSAKYRCNGLIHHLFPEHERDVHKQVFFWCTPLRLCSTLFSMHCTTHEVYWNGVNVCTCGVVEYGASEMVIADKKNNKLLVPEFLEQKLRSVFQI